MAELKKTLSVFMLDGGRGVNVACLGWRERSPCGLSWMEGEESMLFVLVGEDEKEKLGGGSCSIYARNLALSSGVTVLCNMLVLLECVAFHWSRSLLCHSLT